jgi:hypothetical protein
MDMRTLLLVSLLAMLVVGTASAQEYDPDSPFSEFEQAIEAAARTLAGQSAIDAALAQPTFSPSSKQLAAPSSSPVSTAIVDKAGSTELWSVGLDNGVNGPSGNQAITLNLNLFSVLAARDPSIVRDNDKYAKYRTLRRLSGTVSFGELTVDTTGATADSMLTGRFGDVTTLHARIRLLGSRDRRDYWEGPQGYDARLTESRDNLQTELNRFFVDAAGDIAAAGSAEERFRIYYNALINDPKAAAQILKARAALLDELSELNKEVDQKLLVTLDLGGEFRDGELGKDRFSAALIVEGGGVGIDFTGNLEYLFQEAEAGDDNHELRFGLTLGGKALRDTPVTSAGVDVNLSVAGEFKNNDRDNLVRFAANAILAAAPGMQIPVSLIWTSGTDSVLEDDFKVTFGVNYDLAGAWQ